MYANEKLSKKYLKRKNIKNTFYNIWYEGKMQSLVILDIHLRIILSAICAFILSKKSSWLIK